MQFGTWRKNMRKTLPRTVEIDRGRNRFGHSTGMMMNAIISHGGEGHLRPHHYEGHVRRGRHGDPPPRRDVTRPRLRDAPPHSDVRRRRLQPEQKSIIMVSDNKNRERTGPKGAAVAVAVCATRQEKRLGRAEAQFHDQKHVVAPKRLCPTEARFLSCRCHDHRHMAAPH